MVSEIIRCISGRFNLIIILADDMGYSDLGCFGSEIKTILAHPEVRAEIDRDGLTELFALGPAVAPGSAVYKGINEIQRQRKQVLLYLKRY